MRAFPIATALALSALASLFACSGKKNPPPVTPTLPAMDAGDASAEGGLDLPDPDAGAAAPAEAGAGPAVGASLEGAADGLIDQAAATLAKKAAPGMTQEGTPGRGTLAQGGHFGMVVTMQPGRCYTVIGFSIPGSQPGGGVQKLDLRLLAPPLYNFLAGQSGKKDKNAPVMGRGKKKAICPALPIAIPYKVDAVASQGAGRIGVYVYSRAR